VTLSPSRFPVKYYFLVIALVLGVMPFGAARASAAEEKPTLLGFASLDFRAEISTFTQEAGRPPAIYQLFFDIEEAWSEPWVAGLLSDVEDLGMTPYLELTTKDLDALNAGSFDDDIEAMADTIAQWLGASTDRRILIAPLPEMNLIHPWGGDPAGFKLAYQKLRGALLDENLGPDRIRFVFAPNGTSDVGEHEDYYPGDSTVDLIGFSRTNFGTPWRDYNATFQTHIDTLRSQISLTKPILVTQTGSVETGGDRDAWLGDMFSGLKSHDQVIGAIYFNRDKDGIDYRVVVGDSLDPAFKAGYSTWSNPQEVSWIFDGRMDTWVSEREQRYGSGFLDVNGHIFETAITWLAEQKITSGCNPPLNTRFCPDDPVTRGQMAVFLARALGLPNATGDHFADDDGHFYENGANRLFEAGITQGCDTDRYCGDQNISRGQMAALLARAFDISAGGSSDLFDDDDESIFEVAINKIGQAEITVGCNPPTNNWYCPDDLVTRGQMATFLNRSSNS